MCVWKNNNYNNLSDVNVDVNDANTNNSHNKSHNEQGEKKSKAVDWN